MESPQVKGQSAVDTFDDGRKNKGREDEEECFNPRRQTCPDRGAPGLLGPIDLLNPRPEMLDVKEREEQNVCDCRRKAGLVQELSEGLDCR